VIVTTVLEYLNQPAPRTNYASEFGHFVRTVTIFKRTEDYLCKYDRPVWHVAYRVRAATDDQEVIRAGMLEIDKQIEVRVVYLEFCGNE
jgi:hypothetical protein